MKSNLSNPSGSCLLLLPLLLLLLPLPLPAASGGTTLTGEGGTSWQKCKVTSVEILQELWKLDAQRIQLETTIPFPERIECRDNCDPDSLAKNKTSCLMKIRQGLYRYRNLLVQFTSTELTAKIQNALTRLLQLLSEDGGDTEGIKSPASRAEWEEEPLRTSILWRLQSFATLVARVLSHCAALNGNA